MLEVYGQCTQWVVPQGRLPSPVGTAVPLTMVGTGVHDATRHRGTIRTATFFSDDGKLLKEVRTGTAAVSIVTDSFTTILVVYLEW